MRVKSDFFNRQYARLDREPARAVDHAWYRPLARWALSRSRVAAQMLRDNRYERVLELGCGRADLAAAKLAQFGHYTGLDISSYQLSLVPESLRRNPRVTLREYDLNEPLDFPADSFDLVISLSTIEYLIDPEAFLMEIRRVLSPGGTLILHTMNLAFFPRRLQLLFGNLPTFNAASGWEGGILHRFTYPTMKRLLGETGFSIREGRSSGLWPGARKIWPNLLAGDMIFLCAKTERAAPSPKEPEL
jgi:SAM-dependent methyltransferase